MAEKGARPWNFPARVVQPVNGYFQSRQAWKFSYGSSAETLVWETSQRLVGEQRTVVRFLTVMNQVGSLQDNLPSESVIGHVKLCRDQAHQCGTGHLSS